MPDAHNKLTVKFDDELWELVNTEAEHAGVSVSDYVRGAVLARVIVGPTDPRIFEVFAAAVRTAIREEPHPAKRRSAERSLSALARLSASRQQSEAQALRAQSAQIIRMREHQRADRKRAADPTAPPESAFRISADWTEIRAASSRPVSDDGGAPDITWLQDERIHHEDRERVRHAVAEATDRRAMLDIDYRLELGAQTRHVRLRALPLLDAAGTITEWVAVAAESTSDHV
jgi:hypothetical protein